MFILVIAKSTTFNCNAHLLFHKYLVSSQYRLDATKEVRYCSGDKVRQGPGPEQAHNDKRRITHDCAPGGKGDYFREIFRKCYKDSRMSH